MWGSNGRVFVFGSANQDLVFEVLSLPSSGDTVLATSLRRGLGGKGANQAVAAASAGAGVVFVAAVGGDDAGDLIVENLRRRGVDTSWVERRGDESSGLAAVLVDRLGRNEIVVAAGANAKLGLDTITSAMEQVTDQDVVAVQCEIPADRVEAILRAARSRSATVILNLAPPIHLDMETLGRASLVVVNESEARAVVDAPAADVEHLAELVAGTTGRACVVTLGRRGSRYCSPGSIQVAIEAEAVPLVVDTTGAGDTYVGTLAAALAQGRDVHQAMVAASRAAGFSVARPGAQPGLDLQPAATRV